MSKEKTFLNSKISDLGTSNMMSLDVLRSIQKTSGSTLKSLFGDVQLKLVNASDQSELLPAINRLSKILSQIVDFVRASRIESQDFQLKSARDFSFSLAKMYQAVLLLRF